MFDGSFRTNRREINLAGRSTSRSTNRTSHLHEARQQRLARAAAKAKTNAACVLQRCWRGVRCGNGERGRKGMTLVFAEEFCGINEEVVRFIGTGTEMGNPDGKVVAEQLSQKQHQISRMASLLAFRLSSALIPFFVPQVPSESAIASKEQKNLAAEKYIRKDLLALEHILGYHYGTNEGDIAYVSPAAARRLVITILILLRQSFYLQNTQEEENARLVRLLNYLLEQYFVLGGQWASHANDDLWSCRPSDYYFGVLDNFCGCSGSNAGGWLINLFLCLRDSYVCQMNQSNHAGDLTPMDIDIESNVREDMQKILLKWCCQVILHLAALDRRSGAYGSDNANRDSMLRYQMGLALLGSVIFVSNLRPSGIPAWMNEQLTLFLSSLEQYLSGQNTSHEPTLCYSSVLAFFLSRGLNSINNGEKQKHPTKIGHNKIPGINKRFSSFSSTSSSDWIGALSDTMSSREHIVLEQVLSYADICRNRTPQHYYTFNYAIPVILQYALKHQQELAILSSFAARGDDVMSWVSSSAASTQDSTTIGALTTAAGKAYAMEESESDSDEERVVFQQKPNQVQSNSTRHSRADLQTMMKLDSLYQTQSLQAKKRVMDTLQSNATSHSVETHRLALASKIGEGTLMKYLGDAIFARPASLSMPPTLLSPTSLLFLHIQVQESYTSCLAAIMTSCSGLKVRVTSPFLAKLAFHESLLYGLWSVAKEKASLITSSMSATVSISSEELPKLSAAYETFSLFCDMFAHNLFAMDDDAFIHKYHSRNDGAQQTPVSCLAKELVITLKSVLYDLYWARPVLASDISGQHLSPSEQSPDVLFRYQRARLMLSGTKLWNSLYERWCRLYRTIQFCSEDSWWFPHLLSRAQHDNNPIIHSQVTSVGQDDDVMDASSIEDGEGGAAVERNDAGTDALATSFRDPKMARILTCIPQALPFNRRVDLFQSLLESDKMQTQDETAAFQQMMMSFESEGGGSYSVREKVTIRRDSLYTDSMNSLMPLGKKLRKKLQVTFVNKHGVEEAGIDGGGVQKEFFDDLIKDAFLPAQHTHASGGDAEDTFAPSHPDFFVETPVQTLQVNTSLSSNEHIRNYEFLGRVLGKTMYESILVDPQFSLPFLNKLLGKQNHLDDLKNLDPEYYKHLKSLRQMSAKEIMDLGLTFEITMSSVDGRSHSTMDLIDGGRDIPVTKENVIRYIHLVSHQRMNVAGARQTAAFLHGFREIIPAPWVRLFSAYEFQKLISGDDTVKGIDVKGMMSVMRYSGGFHSSQPIIQWLWEVVDEMTPEQQRKFLRFMTSCSRQPLLGFNSLIPAPCIQQTRLREDDYGNDVSDESAVGNIRLPTSATCMNLLKLPKYPNKAMLKEKLLYAIECAAGFELS